MAENKKDSEQMPTVNDRDEEEKPDPNVRPPERRRLGESKGRKSDRGNGESD